MRRSLRAQLTVLFLIIAIIPLLVVAVIGTLQYHFSTVDQIINQQKEIARRVSLSVLGYIQSAEDNLRILIEINDLQKLNKDEARIVLNNTLSFSDVYDQISIVNKLGKETVKVSISSVLSEQSLENLKGTPVFDEPFATGQTYYGPIIIDPLIGEPFMTISIPIVDLKTGETSGVVAARLRFKTIWALMIAASIDGQSVYMTDVSNRVVAHSNPSVALKGVSFDKLNTGKIGPGLDNASAALGSVAVKLDGTETFFVIAELPSAIALSASTRFTITSVIVLLVTILVILFFSVWQTRQLSRPIEELAESARDFAAGKLNSRVAVQARNEIGALGDAFNQMAAQLQNTLQGLEQRVAERTKALETSAEVSRRLASILDPRQLSSAVVNEIRNAYDYYYAQIYLFDETGENLVLTAGTGEAGTAMMKRGHALPKGRGLVGRAAENKESILVSDTSQDPNWLPNELLPDTKAEAVVPIIIGDKVLGVLDVQDDVTNDIFPEDVTLLESLAGQVAISLQNADLYARADTALQEAKSLVENAPEAVVIIDLATGLFADPNENAVKLYGLQRDELVKVGPAQMSPPNQPDGRDSTEAVTEKIGEAMQGKTQVFDWIHRNAQGQDISCEIRLVRMPGDKPRVRASVTDITERKRLQELTAQRARQQEAINTITQRIQSATTIEEAMQVAARELGHAVGNRETLVALDTSALTNESKVDA